MESKEELVALKPGTDNDGAISSAISNEPNEDIDEVIVAQDYSNFSKQDFIDLLKEIALQNDFRKTDAVLKEIKHHFDENLDKERSEALKRFIDNGGSPDDFTFKSGPLDIAFEVNYKILKDRKSEYYKGLEDQKNENLKNKNLLLEELRNLVDGEDNKHSFDKFKEIQNRWKSTGPVPSSNVRTLWASYHALVDRFYDNRNIYFELKELDRKKNLEAKTELCQRVEKLAAVEKIGDAVRELNELHEEFKHIGPVTREEKDALWDRFKKASDAVYARRDAFVANLHQELTKCLELKEQIIGELASFTSFQSDRIKEWNQKTNEIISIQKKWETVGAVPRARAKDINKRFWGAFKLFFNNKGLFFKKLDESRNKNLELKRDLIQQAEALKASQEWDKTANELKALQIKWKEIGPVPEKQRDKVFVEFKAACDYFFEQRRVQFEEADKQQADNLSKKEAICAELERMISEKSGTLEQLKGLQRNFHAIGFVPRQSVTSIKSRFSSLMDKFVSSLDQVSQGDKDKALLEIQLDNLKSDPDASYKIQMREQTLRKKIVKAENDLAILKNNLEFFARSKTQNAVNLRAEVNEKIDAAESEIAQLKSQLKLLKAAAQ